MVETAAEALLLEAVNAAVHGSRVQREPLPPALWRDLFRLAEAQKLLPLVADAVWECPGEEADPILQVGRRAATRQVALQARKDAAFLPVYEGLREGGIDVLVVKGSVCRSVWPNGALRISSDEDLLVPPEQFSAACTLLAEAGLVSVPGADPARDPEVGWRSPKSPLFLELHKYLFSPDSGPFGLLQTVFSGVFPRARTYPTEDGAALRSLSPHDHLLYLLLHAMKHFIRSGFGLRQICDVGLWAKAWQAEIDWPLLARQTEAVHGRIIAAALFAAAERLGIALALPAPWDADAPDPEPLLRDLLDGGIYGSATMGRAHTARITQDAVTARLQGKRRSLRTALFPPAKDLAGDYPILKEHPAMLPLIWQKRLRQYLKRAAVSPEDSPIDTLRLGKQRLALLREYGILED